MGLEVGSRSFLSFVLKTVQHFLPMEQDEFCIEGHS